MLPVKRSSCTDGIEGGFTGGQWTAFEVTKGIQLERLTQIYAVRPPEYTAV